MTESAAAQDNNMSDVEITASNVAGNVHVLKGRGGNVGVYVAEDGVILVDDQFAPLTDKLLAAVAEITDAPLKYVINTHWHGDHTGGNENMAGAGGVIVAHHNVRKRMSTEQVMEAFGRTVEASPPAALPVITFSETVNFHLGEEPVHVHHVPSAHTDGDALVHFRGENVLHAGDTFFNSGYPFIDRGSGGSIQGILGAVDKALSVTDENSKIIPGHGDVTDRAGLLAYRDMLSGIMQAVTDMKAQGMSLEEVQQAAPTGDWDERWGGGFIDAPTIVSFIYPDV